jgi:hypothetical protein
MRDEPANTRYEGSYYWFSYPTAPRSMRRTEQRSHLDFHRLRDGCMILSMSGRAVLSPNIISLLDSNQRMAQFIFK